MNKTCWPRNSEGQKITILRRCSRQWSFVHFLGELRTPWIAFEIYWPLSHVYSLMNMRQFHILFNKLKLVIGLFVDFCLFTCFYRFLQDVLTKLFGRSKQNNFMRTSFKSWWNGVSKYTKINKQSHVKFWLNWRKYRTISYSFRCTFKNPNSK